MGRKKSNTPARSTPQARRTHETPPHSASTSPFSSPSPNVAQRPQQPVKNEVTTRSTPTSVWTSPLWLEQSDSHRASIRRNAQASQQTLLQSETYRHGPAPATIMTSIDGVSMYSNGTSAHPVVGPPGSATDSQSTRSQNTIPATGKILLPKPTLTSLHRTNISPLWSLASNKTVLAPSDQQSRAGSIAPAVPQPFDPEKCHWRALRDVAFVIDGCMEISREELCKLLRFRYAKTDPQMARVQLCHLHSMYEVCKGKEMYESKVEGVIKREMRKDLGDMRGGVEGLVNENF